MKAIAKKDFQSNFHSVTGWLFIAVFWAFLSFFVSNYNFLSLSSDITGTISTVEIIFLILMPILCMRSFSEELTPEDRPDSLHRPGIGGTGRIPEVPGSGEKATRFPL